MGNSRLCVILLTTQTDPLSPALVLQAGHFFCYFCHFSSPSLCPPLLFLPQSLSSYLIRSHFLSLVFPRSSCSFPVQSRDKLNKSPCNGGNISLWQCSISRAPYLLTDWINVLYLVWETTCSGSEGYSQAHRSAH